MNSRIGTGLARNQGARANGEAGAPGDGGGASACCRHARSLMVELMSSTRAADMGREWMSLTTDPRKETTGDLENEPPKTWSVRAEKSDRKSCDIVDNHSFACVSTVHNDRGHVCNLDLCNAMDHRDHEGYRVMGEFDCEGDWDVEAEGYRGQ